MGEVRYLDFASHRFEGCASEYRNGIQNATSAGEFPFSGESRVSRFSQDSAEMLESKFVLFEEVQSAKFSNLKVFFCKDVQYRTLSRADQGTPTLASVPSVC